MAGRIPTSPAAPSGPGGPGGPGDDNDGGDHRQRHTVVSDGYDRDAFAHLLATQHSLATSSERLGRLLPHAEPLLCDLFCVLFKLNLELRPADELSAGVIINRRLVEGVMRAPDIGVLRRRTELNAEMSAAALPGLVDRIISALRREFHVSAEDLLQAAEVAHDEETLAAREEEYDHLEGMDPALFEPADADVDADVDNADAEAERADVTYGDVDPNGDPNSEGDGEGDPAASSRKPNEKDRAAASLARDIDELKERIDAGRAEQARLAERITGDFDQSVGLKVGSLPKTLDDTGDMLRSMGVGQGGEGRVGAARRLELGERLLRSRKLQLLAKLVGAFREVAFEARRRRIARSPQEMHAVSMGRDLARLLPSELMGLPNHRRALHRDFMRRLVEGQLLEYELHGAAARGPMVVCVDGSGSMQGSKELWAKAVALTLMEIARRENRRCLAIVFSAGHQLFEVELLGKRGSGDGRHRTSRTGQRQRVLDERVLEFAEYFPGGGTEFEPPLSRALAAVSEGRYRGGDIVFITDGFAHVGEDLVRKIDDERKRHRFRIRGIAVDVNPAAGYGAGQGMDTLRRICDDVRAVADLTADSLTDLFAAV